jgi:hypothetical protein
MPGWHNTGWRRIALPFFLFIMAVVMAAAAGPVWAEAEEADKAEEADEVEVIEVEVVMPEKPAYMGAARCNGRCHDPWYQAWKATPHARTYELLKPGVRAAAKKKAGLRAYADYTANPRCLRCHTTGYGQKGGFVPGETPIVSWMPSMEQVGCEMCHTVRGGSQVRAFMKKTKGKFKRVKIEQWGARYDYANVCKRCHLHPKSPHKPSIDPKYRFNYRVRKRNIHDYEKYYNESNKDQVYSRGAKEKVKEKGRKADIGVTERFPLMIEDWDIVEGAIRFKKLPLWDGWLIFKK